MPEPVTPSDFSSSADLGDWRVLFGGVEASFDAGTFDRAATFVREIATAADAADHHPDVDLRYPGRVRVVLTTHASHGVTTADADLARTISRLAASAGIVARPHAVRTVEVAIDAIDIDAVRPFWKAVLGYVDDPASPPGSQVVSIVDPSRIGPPFWFQQMDEPRGERNRFHIDVTVPYDIAEDRVAAALAGGGRLVSDRYARAWWVLADAEGNEACVCTWQDRD